MVVAGVVLGALVVPEVAVAASTVRLARQHLARRSLGYLPQVRLVVVPEPGLVLVVVLLRRLLVMPVAHSGWVADLHLGRRVVLLLVHRAV